LRQSPSSWSLAILAVDVYIIRALVAHGDEFSD